MTTDLRDRLHDLADNAPRGGLSAPDVWHHGVRRQRLRRGATVGAAAAVVALVAGLATMLPTTTPVPPAEAPATLGIPRVVVAPDPWAEPTATPGPLAVVAATARRTPDGLVGTREPMTLFGVSAVDGTSRFLDLPVAAEDLGSGWLALSPDGTRLATTAFQRVGGGRPAFAGWDVRDLTTGGVTRLRVPGQQTLAVSETYEISFSGDGRHLLTSFSPAGHGGNKADSLVAWDVATGEPVEAEGPGHYWLPGPATAPAGIAWSRQRSVHVLDPSTGARDQVTTGQDVVEASWSPDGETLLFLGRDPQERPGQSPWRLFVRQGEEERRLDVRGIGDLLGWRDDTHAVVSDYGARGARVLDLETGEQERLDLSGDSFLTPVYAADLWALPVAEPVDQPDADDPRFWMNPEVQWIAVGMLLGGLLQVWLVVRRRRERR